MRFVSCGRDVGPSLLRTELTHVTTRSQVSDVHSNGRQAGQGGMGATCVCACVCVWGGVRMASQGTATDCWYVGVVLLSMLVVGAGIAPTDNARVSESNTPVRHYIYHLLHPATPPLSAGGPSCPCCVEASGVVDRQAAVECAGATQCTDTVSGIVSICQNHATCHRWFCRMHCCLHHSRVESGRIFWSKFQMVVHSGASAPPPSRYHGNNPNLAVAQRLRPQQAWLVTAFLPPPFPVVPALSQDLPELGNGGA